MMVWESEGFSVGGPTEEVNMTGGWKAPWYRAAVVGEEAITCPEHAHLSDEELIEVAVKRMKEDGSYGLEVRAGGPGELSKYSVYDEEHLRIEQQYSGPLPKDCESKV
jgi:hypothetical protein